MGDIKPFSQRQLGRRRRAWLARNRQLLTVVVPGTLLLTAVLTLAVFLMADGQMRWYLIGLTHAGTAAAVLHLLNTAFLAHDREAVLHVRGAWGEDNTRNELAGAKRRRLIWSWVDSITLQSGDIDHLVVTRQAGLVAIDSKWRNSVNTDDISSMAASARTAANRAAALAQTLLAADRSAKHRAKVRTISVTPMVVMWGTAQHEVPEAFERDGVAFVSGRRLNDHLRGMDGHPVDRRAARDLCRRLRRYRDKAWKTSKAREEARFAGDMISS
ncbi:hypothetical protein [uncultured Nocardioides sp.]|uniref:hypothetical protein n=1 Tax=uncultured Nocardioides sp. TaxID=198441 RepID=UPI002604DEA6|nr:hypothetical protein [uncultured Nocardioides sp.]